MQHPVIRTDEFAPVLHHAVLRCVLWLIHVVQALLMPSCATNPHSCKHCSRNMQARACVSGLGFGLGVRSGDTVNPRPLLLLLPSRVEMSETAACLAAATPASLLILDELGRGTASHDGYALAYGVLRHLACPGAADFEPQQRQLQDGRSGSAGSSSGVQQQQLPRLLFATHHHLLTQEPELQDCTQSCHMATRWDADTQQLVHCYKLQPGAAPTGSCGIEVAALAGLPDSVVQRAASVAAVMQEHCEAGGGQGGAQDGLTRKLQGQFAGP